MLKALSDVPVGVYTSPNFIEISGKAECESQTEFDNNSTIEKAKLTFSTLDGQPTHKPLAFIVYTARGDKYIIGCKEAPFPVVTDKYTSGTPGGNAHVRTYEVNFTAKKSLIVCSI